MGLVAMDEPPRLKTCCINTDMTELKASQCIATAAKARALYTIALHITAAFEVRKEYAEKPDAMQRMQTVLTHAELN
eukprot:4681-Heterococcus_DN1.PRE.2